MSAMQRNKGARGEREFLSLLAFHTGRELDRNLIQVRDGGADCLAIEGFSIEIKRHEKICLRQWWKQAVTQAAATSTTPVLAWRQNRQAWQVWVPGYLFGLCERTYAPTLEQCCALSVPLFARLIERGTPETGRYDIHFTQLPAHLQPTHRQEAA